MGDIKLELENIAEQQRNVFEVNQRKNRQRRLVAEILRDYADHSTLHGLRYIVERGVTALQKIFWLLTFIGSLCLCGYYISNVYVKWRTSPVIVSLSEKLVSAGSIPFPSVTICPQIKSSATIYNFTNVTISLYGIENNENLEHLITEDLLYEIAKYEDIATICRNNYYTFPERKIKRPKNLNSTVTKKIYYEVSPSIDKTIFRCQWSRWRCRFVRVVTEEGVCFNFNSVSAEELFRNSSALAINVTENNVRIEGWNSETGYDSIDSVVYPFPLPGKENGAKPDLRVTLVADDNDRDVLCNAYFTGYKIYLHNPLDLPQSSLYYYAALDNQVTSLAVDVNIIKTSESLKSYKPEVRQCYFPQEKYLKFFKIYTAKNCQIECLTNITFIRCKCVGLHMPHYNASIKICKRRDRYCMDLAHELMVSRERNFNWKISEQEDPIPCQCLPLCNNIEYDAQIMKTVYNESSEQRLAVDIVAMEMFDASLIGKGYKIRTTAPTLLSPQLKHSELNIFFKKPLFISMQRSELFGWTDFVANVGGLLGLFLGFSVLSLIEIIYFLTVKIYFALKRDENDIK